MERRQFLKTGALGATAAALATPALAQGKHQWKMVTAWPKNLPGPGVAAQMLADRMCCQTNSKESQPGQYGCPLCSAEIAPLGQSSGSVELELIPV